MKLAAWLKQTKTPDGAFADAIDVSRVTLYRFKKGIRVPDRRIMERINAETAGAVTPNDFFGFGETPDAPTERVAESTA